VNIDEHLGHIDFENIIMNISLVNSIVCIVDCIACFVSQVRRLTFADCVAFRPVRLIHITCKFLHSGKELSRNGPERRSG